jgi:hypothetical protein
MVLKLVGTFVIKVGHALAAKQLADLLLVVNELKIGKGHWIPWNECMGSFI